VRDGRRREFAGGAGFDTVIETSAIPDPNSTTTFEASRPDFSRQQADGWRDLYRRLLQCRRQWLGTDIAETRSLDARVIGTKAVIARWRLPNTMLFVIASNFDETSITAELPSCPPIWGAPSGMTLPAATTLAWIDRDDR
jgi:maltooligosyltrehalose trehalohydrolase